MTEKGCKLNIWEGVRIYKVSPQLNSKRGEKKKPPNNPINNRQFRVHMVCGSLVINWEATHITEPDWVWLIRFWFSFLLLYMLQASKGRFKYLGTGFILLAHFQGPPSCNKFQYVIPSYCQIISHCMHNTLFYWHNDFSLSPFPHPQYLTTNTYVMSEKRLFLINVISCELQCAYGSILA